MEELERLRVKLDSVTRERDALSERAQQLANDLRILTNERDIAVRLAGATAPQLDAKIIEHNALVARVDEMALTQEKLQTKLAEAERAARLNLELLRDARRERDEAQARLRKLAAAPSPVDLQRQLIAALAKVPFHWAASWQRPASGAESHVELHSGAHLFWATNAAGGRTYWSDEVGGGVNVWDTALVSYSTLCEAIAVEFGLLAAERRDAFKAKADEHRARSQASADGPDVPDGPESAGFAPGFEQRAANFVTAGMAAQAAVDALTTPCPTCGALGCRVPCQLLARLQASWNKGSASEG